MPSSTYGCPVITTLTEQTSETESYVLIIISFLIYLQVPFQLVTFLEVVVGLIAVILILVVLIATVLLIVIHKMKSRQEGLL